MHAECEKGKLIFNCAIHLIKDENNNNSNKGQKYGSEPDIFPPDLDLDNEFCSCPQTVPNQPSKGKRKMTAAQTRSKRTKTDQCSPIPSSSANISVSVEFLRACKQLYDRVGNDVQRVYMYAK